MLKVSSRDGYAASVLAFVLAVSAMSAGCRLGSHNIKITVEYADFQRQPHYSRNIDLLLGAELTLVLHANATTGASWTNPAALSDPAILEQTDHHYEIRPDPNPGEAGHEVFSFDTKEKGICTIYLEYKRPFGTEVVYTFTLNVDVM